MWLIGEWGNVGKRGTRRDPAGSVNADVSEHDPAVPRVPRYAHFSPIPPEPFSDCGMRVKEPALFSFVRSPPEAFLPPRPRVHAAIARRRCQGWPRFSGHRRLGLGSVEHDGMLECRGRQCLLTWCQTLAGSPLACTAPEGRAATAERGMAIPLVGPSASDVNSFAHRCGAASSPDVKHLYHRKLAPGGVTREGRDRRGSVVWPAPGRTIAPGRGRAGREAPEFSPRACQSRKEHRASRKSCVKTPPTRR